MSDRDFFVSHASADRAFAQSLVEALENAGQRCWVAPRDIVAGSDYGASIVAGIKASKVFVLVLSGAADSSAHVLREVDRAMSSGKTVVPINIDGVVPSESMEYRLCTVQWLHAPGLKMTPTLIDGLVALAGEHPGMPAPRRTEQAAREGPTAQNQLVPRQAKPYLYGGRGTVSREQRFDERLRSMLIQIAAERLPFSVAIDRARRLDATREDLVAAVQALAESRLLSFAPPLTDDSEISLT